MKIKKINLSYESSFCLLPEIIDTIQTCSSIQTGGCVALVNIHFTALSSETRPTQAGISSIQVLTHPSILARPRLTLIYLQFTAKS